MKDQFFSSLAHPWFSSLVRVAAVWISGLVIHYVIRRVGSFFERHITTYSHDVEHQKRVGTLVRVVRSTLVVFNLFLILALTLSVLGIPVAPLLTAAGIGGVAVGFASQSLVKDYFSGAIFLIEGQLRVGDFVELNSVSGTIEEVTLRYVRVRDLEGRAVFIPNGSISNLANRSLGSGTVFFDVSVSLGTSQDRVLDFFSKALVHESFECVGSVRITDQNYVMRFKAPVPPGVQSQAKFAIMTRITEYLHENPNKSILEVV